MPITMVTASNDRLPGEARDSLLGPDYATTDLRLTRRIYAGDGVVQTDKAIGINIAAAQYCVPSSFLNATDAYAPRQIQLALKLLF